MKNDFDCKFEYLESVIDRCSCLFSKIDISKSEPIELCRKMVYGELTTNDVQCDFEICFSINFGLDFLSILEEQSEHFDFREEVEVINYFQALLNNINSLFILYSDKDFINDSGFFGYGNNYNTFITPEDLNRLASKDITNPTSLMSYKYFEEEIENKDKFDGIDKEKAIQWLKERRHFKPIIEVDDLLKDPCDIIISEYGETYFTIELYVKRLVEYYGKSKEYSCLLMRNNNEFSFLIKNSYAILELSELLDFDFISFCSKVNEARFLLKEKDKEKERIFFDFKKNTHVTYIDVIDFINKNGGEPHKRLTETKYIKPMVFNGNVIAIEKTKKVNIWFQQKICNKPLTSFNVIKYDKTEKDSTVYGRNSNLKKIPELAYDALFKVKVLSGEQVVKLFSIIGG